MPPAAIRFMLRPTSLALLVLIASCSSREADMANQPESTVSGVMKLPDGSQETWHIVEEFRIGNETGDDAIFFGLVSAIAVDEHDQLLVLDGMASELQVFDAKGTLVRTIGRKGAAPGEFEDAVHVDVGPNGNLWVMEMSIGRLTLLDSTGHYLQWEDIESIGWNIGLIADAYLGGFDWQDQYNAAVEVPYSGEGGAQIVLGGKHLVLARYNASLTPIDTVRMPQSPVSFEKYVHVAQNRAMVENVPFQGEFHWRFAPGGNFWTLLTRPYEISEVSTSGEILRTFAIPFDPLRVSDDDLQEAYKSLERFFESGAELDLDKIPSTHPAANSFFVDDDGRIWVDKRAPSSEDQHRLFDIIGADGTLMGTLRSPFAVDPAPIPIIKQGFLYAVSTADDGSQLVIKARIDKSRSD
ncbi:MAG: 6-bladed beta-propeller [Rhodothermaceae bacterium]|nr:6-bladed beta-propeller [Rhodothermaceae bacterium]MYF62921.1 6-bladed beta-propeller [Rhodothermaceae bacterium]MYI85009.1 6-bladed beta-propeller [Rhodothermaceae bacterium]